MATKKFGNIRVLASGKAQARYYLKSGEQVAAGTFRTVQEAQDHLDEIEVDMRRGMHWDGRKGEAKFRDFMDKYMERRQKFVSAGELVNNRSYLKVHLLPAFGHLRMKQIDEEAVDAWFMDQPPTETRRNVYTFLRRAMKFAVKWNYLQVSPCNVLEDSESASRPRPTWTTTEFERVLELVPDFIRVNNAAAPTRVYYREALQIMFAAHLRLGELVGLNANDYDRKSGRLKVERQVTGLGHTTRTKTGVIKNLQMFPIGIAAASRLPARVGNAPLIPGARNDRMPRQSLQRQWVTAVKKAGLEDFHVHDIRHIGLSIVMDSGGTMKDVMARGGHSSVESAMRYQHASVARDSEVVEMAKRFMG